jgi:hypothetical protein
MRRSELPPGAALSRDALLSCGARALLGARRSAPAGAPQARMMAASAAESSKAMGFVKDIAAGTCGGVAVVAIGHPFDTLKVLLQTQPSDKPIYNGVVDAAKVRFARRRGARRRVVAVGESGTRGACAAEVAPPAPARRRHAAQRAHARAATQKTLAAEGIGGLYKGVAAPLTGQMFFRCARVPPARATRPAAPARP